MMRAVTLVILLGGLAMLGVLSGCKDKLPASALERFVTEMDQLEGTAFEDSVRVLAAGDPPYSVYANYLLGNKFYKAAGDTAASQGWGDGRVNALLDSAEVYFNRSIARDSTFIEALVNLGSLWDDRSEQLGSRQEREMRIGNAMKYYNLALDVDPHDEKARCNLGSLYLRQRQQQKAIDEFQKVIEHDPGSSLAHYNLAIMFAEEKIYREALREWEIASKNDPDGDIGNRSRENIRIVKDLMNAPEPKLDP